MAKPCNICGGLILAANEVAGYSGPICSGFHQSYPNSPPVDFPFTEIGGKLDKIIELLEKNPPQGTKGKGEKI